MIYLVLVSRSGGYYVHSAHATEQVAAQWRDCKRHDGEDVSIGYMGRDECEQLNDVVSAADLRRE